MPPDILVEPEFVDLATSIIQRRTVHGRVLETDDENAMFDDEIIHEDINNTIETARRQIRQRIETGQLTEGTRWTPNQQNQWHVTKRDLHNILAHLKALCPGCGERIEEIRYSVRSTEYGRAYLDIITGADNHETDDTNTDGDYDYECSECENEINPDAMRYYIPEITYIALKVFLEEILMIPRAMPTQEQEPQTQRGGWVQPWTRTQARATQEQEFFPVGKQIQKDIPGHGPNGPQMQQNKKGIQVSGPEAFAFRNTGRVWICKHCETENSGENKRCENRHCQKDKFAPVKEIKLTT